jgi:hypothetical protein
MELSAHSLPQSFHGAGFSWGLAGLELDTKGATYHDPRAGARRHDEAVRRHGRDYSGSCDTCQFKGRPRLYWRGRP